MSSKLFTQYEQAKLEHPDKFARDLAALLDVSEAELTHARVGQGAERLNVDARTLLTQLESVGVTKSITRNDFAVHEQVGRYQNQHLNGHAGLILNPRELDLRLFLGQRDSIFALRETTKHGERFSFQFFDLQGNAVHKVYSTDETDMAAWQALLEQYRTEHNPEITIQPKVDQAEVTPNDNHQQIDEEWRAMTDIHQFFQLLKRHNLSRQQAFRAVGNDLAYQVDNCALQQILAAAKEQKNEIMIFVGNGGCVQIFTGVIERIMPHTDKAAPFQQWINVFNRHFTLHLIESAIAESWITRKPTKDGFVTSLELFAADGTQIAQLFGQRSEGQPEQTEWRTQISALAAKDLAA
ncbi:hemin-degrading factor [Yersinia ruckeri]|uniref:hemin-degrading factor n=1 Tax=Yersinia ruckeri TaxID=29486 RepID=UPI0020BDCF74|nr:ChuX/HutX family heme-like substrate-binding protein [Yersinia ruckeri]MCK8573841.1 hemin-degrading factor [Yersinia ruckeri]UZX57109.1 hemin-degrading factor [Yersinia ruckeri]